MHRKTTESAFLTEGARQTGRTKRRQFEEPTVELIELGDIDIITESVDDLRPVSG